VTRINVVPPEELSRQHLLAEYRELPRVFTLARKRQADPRGVPSGYTLGRGHVLFFTVHLAWLKERYNALVAEMRRHWKLSPCGWGPTYVGMGQIEGGDAAASILRNNPTMAKSIRAHFRAVCRTYTVLETEVVSVSPMRGSHLAAYDGSFLRI